MNTDILSGVFNANERLVQEALQREIEALQDWSPSRLDIQDIYALALNRLPPRYRQRGSIVLGNKPSATEVRRVVREAIAVVRRNPTGG